MAPKLAVPADPEGLVEFLTSKDKAGALSNKQDLASVITQYTDQFRSKNADLEEDLRVKLQADLWNMVRASGGGRTPGVVLNGGRPEFRLADDSDTLVAHGKGAAYNKLAPGALLEQKFSQKSDRLNSMHEYIRAIYASAMPTAGSSRDEEAVNKLKAIRDFRNSFGSEDPGAGGFLVPEQMRSELLQLSLESAIMRSRATVIPMSTLRTWIPSVDDTSHVSSVFGGIQFYWEDESAALIESQATFGRVQLEARKFSGFFKVPNELLADAPAFGGWFSTVVPKGLAFSEDIAFLTGNGASKPLGAIGSQNTAYVTVDRASTGALGWVDIATMYSRMLPQSLGSAIWVCSIDNFPRLATMSNTNPAIWLGGWASRDISETPPVSIMGRPVYFSEKVGPVDSLGDISFIDPAYYLIGDRQEMEVAASEHQFFSQNQTAYRIIERVDGRPWLTTPLTPHNGSTSTLSPFVGLSTTHT